MIKKLRPYLFFTGALLTGALYSHAQTGTFTATFTPAGGGAAVSVHYSSPVFKYNNPHGYWFTNPHDGSRHFNLQPDAGYGAADAAFITFSTAENDFEFYESGSGDTNQVALHTGDYFIQPPEYNVQDKPGNKPIHIHYNIFTASEISFTITGTARYGTQKGNGSWIGLGTIQATGHFYREPQYAKSEVLPGCGCDNTIYGYVYDKEDFIRSASACENAVGNKLFDAMQKALTPLLAGMAYHGANPAPAGAVNISILPGTADITVPVKQRPYCTDNYSHNRTVRFDFEKNIFSNDDGFGLRFIKIPSNDEIGMGDQGAMRKQIQLMDSMMKLYAAKKISMDELTKIMKNANSENQVDLKKAEVDHNLYLTVLINPMDKESLLLKMADKAKTVVQHNVPGAAFEIYSPAIKEADGDWITNRMYVYLGQFSTPVDGKSGGGFDAKIVKATYPPNGNKLTVYNIIIKLEGAKDLIDKALAGIDYTALAQLMTKQ